MGDGGVAGRQLERVNGGSQDGRRKTHAPLGGQPQGTRERFEGCSPMYGALEVLVDKRRRSKRCSDWVRFLMKRGLAG